MGLNAKADVEEQAQELILSSDSEQAGVSKHYGRTRKVAGMVSVAMLILGGVGCLGSRRMFAKKKPSDDVLQLASISSNNNFTAVQTERDLCSGFMDNCMETKCCKTSGYICLAKTATEAKCVPSCPAQGPCNIVSKPLYFEAKDRTSMFCFSVYTGNTGSPKKSYEKELIAGQYTRKASIFACDAFEVYSDVSTTIADGLSTVKVDDVDGDFHFAKRKTTGAWVNAGMFMQVWKAIGAKGTYLNYDWTVKVDPDAVFFPKKLAQRIYNLPVPPQGAYLNNCEKVNYGFFGSLEVFSTMAFSTLVANIDTCKKSTVSFWKVGVEGGKWGPTGEDLFAQICMEKNGVVKLDAFDINKDGACPAKRPLEQQKNKKWHADCAQAYTPAMHPFKKPDDYFECMSLAVGL
jgi:hypothetical protein